jgi:hypothetical protein
MARTLFRRLRADVARAFRPSIFSGATLVSFVHPFASTVQERLLLDAPRAQKARTSINRWVGDLDEASRHEFQQRLLAPNNAESALYAFYELVAGQALRKLMGGVVHEPGNLPVGGKPDYGALVNGNLVIFEVRTLEEEMPEAERKGRAVRHELAQIRARAVVVIDWDACIGLQAVRLKALRQAVQRHLDQSTEDHRFEIGIGAALLVGHAYPTNSEMSIIQSAARGGWAPGVEHIRKAVETKARAYRPLKDAGIPFAVVICTDNPLIDAESLFTALFGDLTLRVGLVDGRPVGIQKGLVNYSGCLTPSTKGPARNTIVSAVWLLQTNLSRCGWTVKIVEAHNPWAANSFEWNDDRVAEITYVKDGDAVEFGMPSGEPAFDIR